MLYVALMSVILGICECKDEYLNRVLESKNYARYYLVMKVTNENYEKEIIVLNYDLYKYLSKKNKNYKNIEKYKNLLKEHIYKGKALEISKNGLKEINAVLLKYDSTVSNDAKGGKHSFISKYFDIDKNGNEARIKSNIPAEKFSQITKTLFEWNYLIGRQEGMMAIVDVKFCDQLVSN